MKRKSHSRTKRSTTKSPCACPTLSMQSRSFEHSDQSPCTMGLSSRHRRVRQLVLLGTAVGVQHGGQPPQMPRKEQYSSSAAINSALSPIHSPSPREAKGITFLKFFSFNDCRPELGKKRCFAIAQFYGRQRASYRSVIETNLSWSARGWYDPVHPEVFDNLSIMVTSMHQRLHNEC